jgi:hypothetical protein
MCYKSVLLVSNLTIYLIVTDYTLHRDKGIGPGRGRGRR